MGAYNWIEIDARCPRCRTESRIRAQAHVAASYDGDAADRFHDRTFVLGEAMPWWPKDDARFGSWTDNADSAHLPHVREACYSVCLTCDTRLCVVLEFDPIRASAVMGL